MILVVASLLLLPVSALCGALLVGVLHRHEDLDDGPLVRHFLFMLALFVVAFVGIGRTAPVRRVIDPVWRISQDIQKHPVAVAAMNLSPDRGQLIQAHLAARMVRGASLADALSLERQLLYAQATDVLGFSDQRTHVQWAHGVHDMLEELRTADPAGCFHLRADGRTAGSAAAPYRFAAAHDAEFNAAFIAVMQSALQGMKHDNFLPRDPPVDSDAAALAWREVDEAVAIRFGDDVARSLRATDSRAHGPVDIDDVTLCDARLLQLEEMLSRPTGIAARLTDSLLRLASWK